MDVETWLYTMNFCEIQVLQESVQTDCFLVSVVL